MAESINSISDKFVFLFLYLIELFNNQIALNLFIYYYY